MNNEDYISIVIIVATAILTYAHVLDTDLWVSIVTAYLGFIAGKRRQKQKGGDL